MKLQSLMIAHQKQLISYKESVILMMILDIHRLVKIGMRSLPDVTVDYHGSGKTRDRKD